MLENNRVVESARISIVDDDESMREAIDTLVESIGLRAEGFSSAEEFLNSGASQVCDCLILDIRMPGLSGLELQRRLVADNSQIPIVFMTAHYSEEERIRAMEAGAVDFLSKPFTEQALLNAIGASLAIHREIADDSNSERD